MSAIQTTFYSADDSKGIWTPDTTVKGWCLNRLTMEPYTYYKNKNEFFYVFFEEENDKMFVFVGTDFFYRKNKIKGYAFVNGRLIVYNGNDSDRKQNLVDTTKLIQFVDTIPGFWSDDTDIHMDYEVLRREFVIHGKDSLTLTNLGY